MIIRILYLREGEGGALYHHCLRFCWRSRDGWGAVSSHARTCGTWQRRRPLPPPRSPSPSQITSVLESLPSQSQSNNHSIARSPLSRLRCSHYSRWCGLFSSSLRFGASPLTQCFLASASLYFIRERMTGCLDGWNFRTIVSQQLKPPPNPNYINKYGI